MTSSEKPEENAVEDHYNDITDETLSKEYRHDNSGIPVKVIESSKKAILNDIDSVKVYNDPLSSLTAFDAIKKKNGTNDKISSDTTQSPMIMKMEGVVDDQMEDGRLTTQEPVLPIEIQQEMSTTIATDKVEITTIVDNGKHEENNTESPNVGQSDEKEAVTAAHITTTQATLETKTTAQIPILPEELQTTESDMLITTLSEETSNENKKMKIIDKTVSADDVNNEARKNEAEEENAVTPSNVMDTNSTSERSMAATTMYENNVSLGSGQSIEYNGNERVTESAKIETTLMMSTTEKDIASSVEGTSPMPNDITTTEDVRPVTEMLDDTQPMTDYRILFTTIPPRSIFDPELSEEALRVIPLEKSPESKKKSIDKKGFDKYKYKKEKDLSLEDQNEDNVLTERSDPTSLSQTEPPMITTGDRYEELNDSVVSSDIDPHVPRFTVADKEGNILPISKWKNTGTTDRSENKDAVAETKPKNYPSFIPVSEEIIESVPVTEPYVIMRNYTRPAIVSDGAESTAANETTAEGRADARANETAGHDVTLFSDQSFGDAEEAEVDRVTEEPITTRLTTQTSSLDVEVESTTAIPSSPSGFSSPILSKCTIGQFQCVNGTSRNGAYCVPQSAKCDSENDCSDGSDELNCEAEGCPGNFRCASGQCLKRHLVCNKIVDCDDGSDEHDCESWQCHSDEFKCPSGKSRI